MPLHPALMMIFVWAAAALAFVILPFEMVSRAFHLDGILILFLFLIAFCAGACFNVIRMPQRPVTQFDSFPMRNADLFIKTLCILACITFGLEIIRGGALDLVSAYQQRSNQAQALLHGGLSNSSSLFKLGFLCYPAGYVYLVREIILERKPRLIPLVIFGILPGVLAGLALGGRAPLFNTIAYATIAYFCRSRVFPRIKGVKQKRKPWHQSLVRIATIALVVVAFNYFINVFIVRAEFVGGADMMLNIVALQWGVTFGGPTADLMIAFLGPVTTYLIFVFVWYLVQGLVMSNSLFVSYAGDALYGVYGIDLLSALMRRVDPIGVSAKFNYLLELDTYGFLPSAYGSIFVDFKFGGLVFIFIWGWLCGLVYRRTRQGHDPRWFLFVPFVIMGIIFSLINTPLGFANGFVTHVWLLAVFLLAPRYRTSPTGQTI
ncbi:MAG: oligosaccharide repeat unit polymerase [Sulfitobacter sp.]